MPETHASTVAVLYGRTADAEKPPAMQGIQRAAEVRYATDETLGDALDGADVLFVWDFNSTALFDAWPHAGALRWVHAASAGVNHVLTPGVVDGDIAVTNSRGIFDEPMAEYVLGVILAFAKDLAGTVRLQAENRWKHRETERVTGARALVVGTGPIGRAIGRRLRANGLVVTGVGRTARSGDPDLGDVVAFADLPDALPDADYVVLAAPLTDQTRGMIDTATLARMRPTARLINVGRGPLVREDDLVTALAHRRIAGAALDVFEAEPLPADSPLWTMDNVIVSPHMSGDVIGWRHELVELFADNLARYGDGQPLRNLVDKSRGYVRSEARSEQRGQG